MSLPSVVIDQILFSLDRCAPHWGLTVCRILYNKPVSLLTTFFNRIAEAFSAENIYDAMPIPFLPLLAIPTYMGLILLFSSDQAFGKASGILRVLIVLYSITLLASVHSQFFSVAINVAFIFIGIRGIQTLTGFILKYVHKKT